MRLDKFLCDNNIGTRSQVKEYIKKGQVTVNDQIIKKPETKVNEETDTVVCQGQPIHYRKYVYYMLNKPEGVVSATNDNTAPTVVSLLTVPEQKDPQKISTGWKTGLTSVMRNRQPRPKPDSQKTVICY